MYLKRLQMKGFKSFADTTTLELEQLHDRYVAAINGAVADGNDVLVGQLAAEYDDEALLVMQRSAA